MTYELHINGNCVACTGDYDWLVNNAIPFHKCRMWYGDVMLILSFNR